MGQAKLAVLVVWHKPSEAVVRTPFFQNKNGSLGQSRSITCHKKGSPQMGLSPSGYHNNGRAKHKKERLVVRLKAQAGNETEASQTYDCHHHPSLYDDIYYTIVHIH